MPKPYITNVKVAGQMKIAHELLMKIYPTAPFAIVAGGAPRNWYFGLPANDIDIFFYNPDLNTLHVAYDVFGSLGISKLQLLNRRDFNKGDDPLYPKNPKVKRVFNYEYKGEKVQFVQMTSPTFNCVPHSFPLSICKIWYKDGDIHTTEDFTTSVKTKSIYKTDQTYANGDAYIQRILGYFPDYKYYESESLFMRAFFREYNEKPDYGNLD